MRFCSLYTSIPLIILCSFFSSLLLHVQTQAEQKTSQPFTTVLIVSKPNQQGFLTIAAGSLEFSNKELSLVRETLPEGNKKVLSENLSEEFQDKISFEENYRYILQHKNQVLATHTLFLLDEKHHKLTFLGGSQERGFFQIHHAEQPEIRCMIKKGEKITHKSLSNQNKLLITQAPFELLSITLESYTPTQPKLRTIHRKTGAPLYDLRGNPLKIPIQEGSEQRHKIFVAHIRETLKPYNDYYLQEGESVYFQNLGD